MVEVEEVVHQEADEVASPVEGTAEDTGVVGAAMGVDMEAAEEDIVEDLEGAVVGAMLLIDHRETTLLSTMAVFGEAFRFKSPVNGLDLLDHQHLRSCMNNPSIGLGIWAPDVGTPGRLISRTWLLSAID